MSKKREQLISQYLLDTEIRGLVKPYLEPWQFNTGIYKNFVKCILNDQFDNREVDLNAFQLLLSSIYKESQEDDWREIKNVIHGFIEPDEENRKYVIEIISEFIQERLYWKGTDLLALNKLDQASVYLTQATNFKITQAKFTKLSDRKKLVQLLEKKFPKDGRYLRSAFSLINNNATFKGYRRGDLVMYVSPPGRGKTTLMAQEAVTLAHQGFKCSYIIIGDNEEDDIAIKACAFKNKVPLEHIIEHFDEFLVKDEQLLDNINSYAYPCGVAPVHQILADAKSVKDTDGLDVLFVDYDANIAMAKDDLYQSGGIIYSALKAFAQINDVVVIVASQPGKPLWKEEILTLDSANESSKKQHAVDMMITFNWNPECHEIGSLHMAKIRRGRGSVTSRVEFKYHIAEIEEITEDEYEKKLQASKVTDDDKKEYTLESLEMDELK